MVLYSWIAAALMLLGNTILIKSKSWISFAIMSVANFMYMYYWFIKQEWSTLVLVSIFFLQSLWGLIKWWKEQHAE
jgi:hypothetical protein